VLQYIADRAPESGLAPAAGTLARYRLIEWLNFVTTELHKKHMWMVFGSKSTPELKAWSRTNAPATLAYVERYLTDREYLVGDRFTVADIYLFWTLLVAPHGGISLDAYPAIKAYVARIQSRPSVQTALAHDYPLYTSANTAKAPPKADAPQP
ncbi:MAG TPA: glutathione S-transferase family protein, partial [Kofleriaceae bacterium]